jgi:hypothetical protein
MRRRTRKTSSRFKHKNGSRRSRSHAKRRRASYQKRWDQLSPADKVLCVKVLEVLRLMRNGYHLTSASRQVGIDFRTAKSRLRDYNYIYKKRGRWRARARDRISRGLVIYERGKIKTIVVNDSAIASIIGEYFNDTKKVLESGNAEPLWKYKKLTIRDAQGRKHKLETRLEKLKEIELSREDIEFGDIYAY